METVNISIIGAGRVGTTIAYLFNTLKNKNIKLTCVASRTQHSLDKLKQFMGNEASDLILTTDFTEAARLANCLLLATPDDAIEVVSNNIFSAVTDYRSGYVIHFSGSKSLQSLSKAKEAGAHIGCMHPIKSFASANEAVKTIKGTVFGITCSNHQIKELIIRFVEILEGSTIEVADDKKPLYHAACCTASNYLVALMDYSVAINEAIGIKPQDSVNALMGLVEGTLENIKKMGTKKSLTGPIARGDVGTIQEHLTNFSKSNMDQEIYRLMGKKAAEIAYGNNWIENKTYKKLINILGG